MFLILLGLLLWSGVHFWKRISPDSRAQVWRQGQSDRRRSARCWRIVLMVIGYRGAEGTFLLGPHAPR